MLLKGQLYLLDRWDKLLPRSVAGENIDVPRSHPNLQCFLAFMQCNYAGIRLNNFSPPLANWKNLNYFQKKLFLWPVLINVLQWELWKLAPSGKLWSKKRRFENNKNSVLEILYVVGRQNSTVLKNWSSEICQPGLNVALSLTGRPQTSFLIALYLSGEK